jgi:bifunctional DNA-binding transcriptional regulator/antitoxin component of YhaV-PrlF toxin-antitoxin module
MGLKEGDEIKVTVKEGPEFEIARADRVEEALRVLRHLAAKTKLPPGWKFDREEIYEDRMRELGW